MQSQSKFPAFLERHWLNGLIILFLALLYVPLLLHWVDGWINKTISIEHEYFSHGLIGIPYAAYIVWTNRHKWQRLEDRSHPLGAVLLGLGVAFYLSDTVELVNLSFPIVLTGICLWLKGGPGLKLNAFPLGFVFFATPNAVPYLLTVYTLPLQKFIATTAGFILYYFGMTDIVVEEIYLSVGGRLVEVAPYCAGLKMLFTSLYVAALLLHWTGLWRSLKKTLFLFLGAIIISVTVNIFRNTILTYLYGMGFDPAFEFVHEGTGGDLISLGMLLLIVLWLDVLERVDQYRKTGNGIGILDYGAMFALPLNIFGGGTKPTPESKTPEPPPEKTSEDSQDNHNHDQTHDPDRD
ncbi:cyanoexosortase B [Spirulina sp. CS-785/01]|uniref:cyanoexosortase B n=1 Tax=Spirulina sp. CS-785/01 TaxID=3021716 RepID=UPI00232B3AF8|nr:cyanoexosortase B [Spirulina sp. CS-785/01]MDB9313059.1 cyanoexosortase B [Spirulina sp. CS-785/01]